MTDKETMKEIWGEAYQLFANFSDLCESDIIDLRDTMLDRCERIMVLAGVDLTDEDVEVV